MRRALAYLASAYLQTTLAAAAAVALIILVGSQLLRIEMFGVYYFAMPLFLVMFALLLSTSVSTLYRNSALSFGCRRRDFFWASQLCFVLVVLAYIALLLLAGWLPKALLGHYATLTRGDHAWVDVPPPWLAPLPLAAFGGVFLILQPIGAAMGGLFVGKGLVPGVICGVILGLLGMAGVVVTLFVMDGSFAIPTGALVGVGATAAALALAGEIYFYRSNKKAIVR